MECQFVIAKAFYPLPLVVSHKIGVHHRPAYRSSDTLGRIIARFSLTFYALRWRVLFPLTSELAVKQFVDSNKAVSPVSGVHSFIIEVEYLAPFDKRSCRVADSDFDV